jgi:uncharacterized protein YkwD
VRTVRSRLVSRSIAALAVGVSLCGASAAAPSAADCPNADAQPDEISVNDYATSLRCVVNDRRRESGRGRLAPQRNLKRAASRHASEMVVGRYFAHTSPDGVTFVDRLAQANFIPRAAGWRAGENLAAGRGTLGTPTAIVRGWMNSKEHRRNLLDPGYTMVGIGVTRGWPAPGVGQRNSVTIDMDLGWRSSAQRSSRRSRRP